jgi:hypothetical protein
VAGGFDLTNALASAELFTSSCPSTPPTDFFLDASGVNLFLNSVVPTSTAAQFKDSAAIRFSGGNPWTAIGTWTGPPAGASQTLTDLHDLRVWIGLKNSDDIGTRFDLRAEIYKNSTLLAAGETYCITGVTRNPSLAKEVTVAFGSIPDEGFGVTDVISLKVFTRIGTTGGALCGGHSNAVGLRLYFDSVSRPSRFSGAFE